MELGIKALEVEYYENGVGMVINDITITAMLRGDLSRELYNHWLNGDDFPYLAFTLFGRDWILDSYRICGSYFDADRVEVKLSKARHSDIHTEILDLIESFESEHHHEAEYVNKTTGVSHLYTTINYIPKNGMYVYTC